MNLDIVGNIKIDLNNKERVKFLLCCLESVLFLKSTIALNLESASDEFWNKINRFLDENNPNSFVSKEGFLNYGQIYTWLLTFCQNEYILNFEDDHFCLLEDVGKLEHILTLAKVNNVQIIKSSFSKVENESAKHVKVIYEDEYCKIFEMNVENYLLFQTKYPRYFLGTNCIFEKNFAFKFWSRNFKSSRPHEWEIKDYSSEFKHRVLVPKFEILAPINDNHGEEGTCLLERKEEKWLNIYNKQHSYA